jgi:hypothetical protein
MSATDRLVIFFGAVIILILALGRTRPSLTVLPVMVPEALGMTAPPILSDPMPRPVAQAVGGTR